MLVEQHSYFDLSLLSFIEICEAVDAQDQTGICFCDESLKLRVIRSMESLYPLLFLFLAHVYTGM